MVDRDPADRAPRHIGAFEAMGAWGRVVGVFFFLVLALGPITSAISQPDPGTYQVYAKDLNASSNLTGEYSTMTHFVAFTYGKYQGARIALHSVPKYPSGEYVQPLDSVGTQELFGESSGCIRVLPEHAEMIWNWLDIGDTVKVVT